MGRALVDVGKHECSLGGVPWFIVQVVLAMTGTSRDVSAFVMLLSWRSHGT